MSKFSKKVFTTTSNTEVGDENKRVVFIKQDEDNKIFPEIQIRDISSFIHEGTIGKLDGDTMIYQACSNMETKYIEVQHKTEDVYVELQGIREFKGQTKLISAVSWLGVENEKRKVQELPLWEVSDFEVTPKSKLDMDFDKAVDQAKIQIHKKLKSMRQQYGIPKIDILLGEGDNFRNLLPTCKPYKGNRAETLRPIILKEIRKWVVEEMGGELATVRDDGQVIECDDLTEFYGNLGYLSYRKTGKFDFLCIASDKDAMGNPKLLVNPDKHSGKDNPLKGKWKYPQAMLIEATDKSCGGIDLISGKTKKEIKGYGLKWIIYQSVLGEDSADHYSALKHLGRKFNYGEVSAYEDLYSVNTPKDIIQKAVDVFAELLPYGVQYTTHSGEELDVDTLTYMNTYFEIAYMLRSASDSMSFTKLCKAFKVDTSAITDNNKLSPPELTFNSKDAEKNVANTKELCENVLSEIGSFKSLKKGDLVEKLDNISDKIKLALESFEEYYEYTQKVKQLEEK